jgi:ATP-binding cassette, subfamily C, bacterial LapB
MVRSLIGNPRVILFDEANTGLDQGADERMITMLQSHRGDAAVIIVTFRPSLLAVADRVYQIEDGRVVEKQKTSPQTEARAS